jgi:hypothetical protein
LAKFIGPLSSLASLINNLCGMISLGSGEDRMTSKPFISNNF